MWGLTYELGLAIRNGQRLHGRARTETWPKVREILWLPELVNASNQSRPQNGLHRKAPEGEIFYRLLDFWETIEEVS